LLDLVKVLADEIDDEWIWMHLVVVAWLNHSDIWSQSIDTDRHKATKSTKK